MSTLQVCQTSLPSVSANQLYVHKHRVLQIEEIIRMIFATLRRADLAAMSQVNKRLGNVALDLLWERTDMETLLCLFPSYSDRKEFSSLPTDRDWGRYNFYAPRVRTLYRTRGFVYGPKYRDVLFVLRERGRLVHLRRLLWNYTYMDEISGLGVFLVPSLIHLEITRNHDDPIPFYLSSTVDALGTLLRKLIDYGVSLKTLKLPLPTISDDLEPIFTLYQTKLPSLITRNLIDVGIFASYDIIRILSTIPTLSYLALRFQSGEHCYAPGGDTSEAFQYLQSLKVYEAASLREVTSLIRAAGCVPEDMLDIRVTSIPSGYKVTQLLDVVLASKRGRSIRCFELRVSSQEQYFEIDEDVDEDHDIFTDPIVTFAHFRRLLELDIQFIRLGFTYSLDISDEQLKELASSWPNLDGLHLLNSLDGPRFPVQNSVSLQGLRHLASLMHLEDATLQPKIIEGDIPQVLEAVSISPLEKLNVLGSIVERGDVIPTAVYLTSLFPKLRKITSFYDDEEHVTADGSLWCRVLDHIQELHSRSG